MTSNEQLDKALLRVIAAALAEDIGPGDITSRLLIPESAQAQMQFTAREDMVACGAFIPAAVYVQLDSAVKVKTIAKEGQQLKKGDVLAVAEGPVWALLSGERVALNLMQRMCGVATLTAKYVKEIAGTKAIILDTRKTMPGLRALDKYAVKTGGGQNHRIGLWDAVLIKDNHIAMQALGVGELIRKAKTETSVPVIVECDTLAQVEEALQAKPHRILLDNMDVTTLCKAVELVGGQVPLEASGGVSLKTVRAIAETGVDYISVGNLTHSAQAVDIGADTIIESKTSQK